MTMTIESAAKALDGDDYGSEGSAALWAVMKSEGLVAVFGASDDLMEFRGAIDDEFYGDTHIMDGKVLQNECECDDCPNYSTDGSASISPIFCKGVTFDYVTKINCARFTIVEDGGVYGYGMVFDLHDTAE